VAEGRRSGRPAQERRRSAGRGRAGARAKRWSRTERERRRGRAFTPEEKKLADQMMATLERVWPGFRKWLVLNLTILTLAVLTLCGGARSGNGWLTLSALARAMPLTIAEKMREKRLWRLLRNKSLDAGVMTPLLIRLVLGERPPAWIPIVVDQTTIRGVQTIVAGIRLAGRTLPVAFTCFQYDEIRKSQNVIESALLKLVVASLPPGCKPLFLMDRGYARVDLLRELRLLDIPYLIRGRKQTMIRVAGERLSLGRLRYRARRPKRYVHVLYHGTKREPVDVVVYHDPSFKEPWFLLVPPESEKLLPTTEVVQLYRERMWVELTFRDWKTHLGVRGLQLESDPARRLERVLLALTVAYILLVHLGASPAGRRVRQDCEVLRRVPRHGTRRRLGALTIGILLLSLARFTELARYELLALLRDLRRGVGCAATAASRQDRGEP